MAMDKLDEIKDSHQALCLSLLPLEDIMFGFWGCVEEYVYDEEIRTIIDCGKYVERLDLYLRLKYPFAAIEREFGRLCASLRKVPKNTPYRYNTSQLCILVEIMGMGERYTDRAWARLFLPSAGCLSRSEEPSKRDNYINRKKLIRCEKAEFHLFHKAHV